MKKTILFLFLLFVTAGALLRAPGQYIQYGYNKGGGGGGGGLTLLDACNGSSMTNWTVTTGSWTQSGGNCVSGGNSADIAEWNGAGSFSTTQKASVNFVAAQTGGVAEVCVNVTGASGSEQGYCLADDKANNALFIYEMVGGAPTSVNKGEATLPSEPFEGCIFNNAGVLTAYTTADCTGSAVTWNLFCSGDCSGTTITPSDHIFTNGKPAVAGRFGGGALKVNNIRGQ